MAFWFASAGEGDKQGLLDAAALLRALKVVHVSHCYADEAEVQDFIDVVDPNAQVLELHLGPGQNHAHKQVVTRLTKNGVAPPVLVLKMGVFSILFFGTLTFGLTGGGP